MIHKHAQYYFRHLKDDLPAGIVVFLVALPLCLGIALASGAPLFAGLITGLVGGLIVSWLSGSQLAISGPAAGLTVIVFNAIETLGSFQGLLVACLLAGILQLALGYLRAGIIGAFFPSAVIEGMLAAIGLILIIKQLPHATGYHGSYEGDESYMKETAHSSFVEFFDALSGVTPGAVVISAVALLLLILWGTPWFKKQKLLKLIPGPLVAVLWGVGYNFAASQFAPDWAVSSEHLVKLPISEKATDFFNNFMFPDFSYLDYLTNPQVYVVAITIAIIASLETLLSLEATDKLDPLKRIAPTNRELKAQGVGNIICGLIGGLPMTAVIVRSAASINAGGRTRVSCFTHGLFLLLSVLFFAYYLNYIPLPCLAAILLHTGYKLANPKLFSHFYYKGMSQFMPFAITVLAILFTDLLKGMAIGLGFGLFFVIKANYSAAITLVQDGMHYVLLLNKDVSFLNKALLRKFILRIEADSTVTIDASKAKFIDHDILETIEDFLSTAPDDNIGVEIIDLYGKEKIQKHEPLVVLNARG
ncbi:SulP family inorganic anion transporter [Candidatus Methylobacter oryzae]|uniref:SulP family inorganic anion transporter n=1 Tax=Candidatus Methylobacter oryzae TaxID=2497749 RepID=A0ABY3C635_9GAMM|nr:SulP family inorganic anion transporter [Candidatus Methylobacter oryzae]TRW90270.1 SulP family inorganic anion transporter [Candidatus Methylobacter oryzae]